MKNAGLRFRAVVKLAGQVALCAGVALFSLTGCKAKSDEVQGANGAQTAAADPDRPG